MKVSLMQKVDYWLGIPLCAVLSLWRRLAAVLAPVDAGGKPRRILFIELSEMGSAILAYSAIERAGREFGATEVYFAVFRRNRESLDLLRVIEPTHVFEIQDKNLAVFAASLLKAIWRMRRLKIDTVIDLELFSRCTALISYLSGAPRRAGFHNHPAEGLYRGSFLTHPVLYNPQQHISVNFLNLLYALQAEPGERPLLKRDTREFLLPLPPYRPSPAETGTARALIESAGGARSPSQRLVLLNPDPGLLELRGWPIDYFAELAERIVKEHPESLIAVVGLARSKKLAGCIAAALPRERFIDLSGKTPRLAELVALLAMAHVFITNDSGPAHFASLAGVPTIVLFGPETPNLYSPLGDSVVCVSAGLGCSPCYSAYNHRRTICRNNRCMQAIPVERVYSLIRL